MRRGVVLGSVLALVLVLPAAARLHDETVMLTPGKSVTLKSTFDRNTQYTVTVSGLMTFTVTGASVTYDPLFSFTGNCQNATPGVGVRILSRGTDVFSPFSLRRPPSCRSDHTYTFTLNTPPPSLAGVLSGRVTAKNDLTVNAARGDSASGSFKLEIEPDTPAQRDVKFTVSAKKERTTLDDPLLADVRLNGAVWLTGPVGAKTARGLLFATLVWLTREDTRLTLQPQGEWTYSKTRKTASGGVRVTRSSDGTCLKGGTKALSLDGRRQRAVLNLYPCAGLAFLRWSEPSSDVEVSVKEVGT